MKVAIYARYSSEAQNHRSLEDQIRECRNYAERFGWSVLKDHIYEDAALSGMDVQRPQYLRLKQAASDGYVDCVIVDDLSRLGRDVEESAKILREFKEIGVRIIGAADGIDTSNPSSKIPFLFRGIMNEMYLDDLRAKVIRGLKGQVIRGYSPGGRVYGYKTKQILDPSNAMDKFGRPKRLGCEIIIDKIQAKVVRKIFELRCSGYGYRRIANYLNEKRISSPHSQCGHRSGFWGSATIRVITLNKKYIGEWTWNKTNWINRSRGGKRIVQERPESDWVSYQNEKLRIVKREIWQEVAALVGSNKHLPSGRRGSYLMSGLMKCGDCGSNMIVQNSGRYSCYMCNGYRNGGQIVCQNNHRIPRHELERAFISELCKILHDSTVIRELLSKTNEILKARFSSRNDRCHDLRSQQYLLRRQIANLLKLVEVGDTSQAVSEQIKRRETEMNGVVIRLSEIEKETNLSPEVTTEWISNSLNALSGLIQKHNDKMPTIRQELKNLFPDRLTVNQEEASNGTLFKIAGLLHPFTGSTVPTSLMSSSGAGI